MKLRLERTAVCNDIDPHLQRVLCRHGEEAAVRLAAAAVPRPAEEEVAVVARVRSPRAWRALTGVSSDATVGPCRDMPGYVVTGRVAVGHLTEVRADPAVHSLKMTQGVGPVLATATKEVGARPVDLPPDSALGRGVILGVVDFGLDFAHPNFRKATGSTRLAALWDQRGTARESSPYGYGRLYGRAEINRALKARNPYAALGYGSRSDPYWQAGTHGTHVTDIAAGNGRGTGTPGVAPEAEIAFVDLAASDIPWEGEGVVNASFGDSVQLLEALTFLFDLARRRRKPCVVNLSLGTFGGPHDGSTLLEQGIDSLVAQAAERAVVVAAGNGYMDGIHAAGRVGQGAEAALHWDIPSQDASQNELELWYSGQDRFVAEIEGPDGRSLGTVALGENARVKGADGETLAFVAHRRHDPNNGDNVLGVFLSPGAPAGVWTLRLRGETVTHGHFHAWIERDDTRPSHFLPPHDNAFTLGSLSTGHLSIAVGAYNAHLPSTPLAPFTAAGPTRDGRPKPELSAPGQDVWAARSLATAGLTPRSGTSMAAPVVAGVVALMLSAARSRGRKLTATEIRAILDATARQDPPGVPWHPRYGRGRVSAVGAVEGVRALGG